jgi:hypothetical protein
MKRFTLLAILVVFSGAASAQTMECGNKLITRGDSIAKVGTLCGNPTQVDHSSIVRYASAGWVNGQWVQSTGGQIEIPVEIWLYNLGPDRLMRQIRFEDGYVVKIETLDYGYIEGASINGADSAGPTRSSITASLTSTTQRSASSVSGFADHS